MQQQVQESARDIRATVAAEVRRQLVRDDYLNTAAAAKFLSVSTITMASMRRRGTGPEYVGEGKWTRYKRSVLAEFIEKRAKS
jgi:hypothetical protein